MFCRKTPLAEDTITCYVIDEIRALLAAVASIFEIYVISIEIWNPWVMDKREHFLMLVSSGPSVGANCLGARVVRNFLSQKRPKSRFLAPRVNWEQGTF